MPDSTIRVIAKQRPTVVLNRVVADVASVVRDNVHGMRLAVEHLAALGHHDLTYVEGPADSWADGVRWRSIREASLELGVRARRIGPFPADVASGMRAADELLASATPRPSPSTTSSRSASSVAWPPGDVAYQPT
jgi:LacI family repressor for deo operon, udp, cdd, tsx, nupC, and nupG